MKEEKVVISVTTKEGNNEIRITPDGYLTIEEAIKFLQDLQANKK